MRLKLPEKVKEIIDALTAAGFSAYAVGGCVRDSILAREPQDWDITTSAKPEEIKRIFRRTVDTGIEHGTVTVLLDQESFEVTTYRIDGEYKDGRHPTEVIFTPNLQEDLLRRDFTINAMAYNDTEGLIDLYGGMDDLQQKIIRCVGDADERFSEDALRVLRALRFSAQLNFSIDQNTLLAIRTHAGDLRKISAERIKVELEKMLISARPDVIEQAYRLGVTQVILPEFDRCMVTPQRTPYHDTDVGNHTIRALLATEADPILRWTMLFHDFGKPSCKTTDEGGRDHFYGHAKKSAEMAEAIMRRLKFDNESRKKIKTLICYHDSYPEATAPSVRKAIHRVGVALFPYFLAVQWADTSAKSAYRQEEKFVRIKEVQALFEEITQRGDCLSLKDLAIGGEDLMAIGIQGEEIGRILNGALKLVLEDQNANTKEFLLEYARYEHLRNSL